MRRLAGSQCSSRVAVLLAEQVKNHNVVLEYHCLESTSTYIFLMHTLLLLNVCHKMPFYVECKMQNCVQNCLDAPITFPLTNPS